VESQNTSSDLGAALGPLASVNRISIALSGATGTADLAKTVGAILTSPLGSRFSRVVLLTYDAQRECCMSNLAPGIGLTLVKRLREATGGHIVVVSKPQHGRTFPIMYPALKDEGVTASDSPWPYVGDFGRAGCFEENVDFVSASITLFGKDAETGADVQD
jgi:hypothetical protein